MSLLSRLVLPESDQATEWKVKAAMALSQAVRDVRFSHKPNRTELTRQKRPFSDASSRNALSKFETGLTKRYSSVLEGFSEVTFRETSSEEVKAIFDLIDEACASYPRVASCADR